MIVEETRYERKNRLKGEGKWRGFLSRRNQLVQKGYSRGEADTKADQEFQSDDPLLEAVEEGDGSGAGMVSDDFESYEMDPRAIVEFVFNHIGLDDVRPSDAPCPGAFAYLTHVKNSPDLLEQFYSRVWTKLLKGIEEGEERRFEDDGRKIINLAERLERESEQSDEKHGPTLDTLLSSGSEGEGEESGVQETDGKRGIGG